MREANDFILNKTKIYDRIIIRSGVFKCDRINWQIYQWILLLKYLNCAMVYSIVNQLERSATSIGANIREANYAHSKPDFIAKLQISLKECFETEYWLELMQKAEIISDVDAIMHD